MQTYKELVAQREALELQIAKARALELSEAVSQVRNLIAEHGLTQEDVFSAKSGRTGKITGPVPAKYRDPVTGATWTGRGRAPLWIADKDRTQFAI
ncbi:H-NS histone family protein [Acidovorax sp.]|uniref:H-NS histone family protein n=1 Tax=Acidovorax sp. TaxID=1872122 RepID=UPI0040383493